jgi:hypothetical protein
VEEPMQISKYIMKMTIQIKWAANVIFAS